jgi:hypothetical protein
MSDVVRVVGPPERQSLLLYCPRCRFTHLIPVRDQSILTSEHEFYWLWDGNREKPTLIDASVDIPPRGSCHFYFYDGCLVYIIPSDHKWCYVKVKLAPPEEWKNHPSGDPINAEKTHYSEYTAAVGRPRTAVPIRARP